MLCLPGLGCKDYWTRLKSDEPLPELACPIPNCEGCLRLHGWYHRYLGGILVPFRRLRCPRCRVSHALLPEDVVAYHDLTLPALEALLKAEGGPTPGARAAQQPGVAGVRRARRWKKRVQCRWVNHLLAVLPGTPGNWWTRVQATFGKAPGALIRLRHWLWPRWSLFFSGLSGFYRHGRPRMPSQRNSTECGRPLSSRIVVNLSDRFGG